MYNVLDICLFIIQYSHKQGYSISNLKLQKILYFVQAYFLVNASNKMPCFSEKIEAWDFGPVVPEAYHEFKRYGSANIPLVSSYFLIDEENFWNSERIKFDKKMIAKQDRKMIEVVVDGLSNISANSLVDITHGQAPWKNAYIPRRNMEISVNVMREYFNAK